MSLPNEGWARLFHEAYERLAPSFGYETRKDTKQFDPESPNGKLMAAVCGEVVQAVYDEGKEVGRESAQPIVDEEAWIRETVDAMAGKVDDAFQSHLRNILRERLPLLKGEK